MWIRTVFVRVSDIEKATKWYKDFLEVDVKWTKPKIAAFQLENIELTITEQEIEKLKDITFNLEVENINDLIKRANSKCIKISNTKIWEGIKYVTLYDLDNNEIQVIEKNND